MTLKDARKNKEIDEAVNKSNLIIVGLFAGVWFPFLVVMMTCFVYTISGLGLPLGARVSFVWTSVPSL